jgi:hypothetical protein
VDGVEPVLHVVAGEEKAEGGRAEQQYITTIDRASREEDCHLVNESS